MARKPRLDKRGCLYHVMGRGNVGAAIFSDDEDRREFLGLLAEGVERFGHTVHAYCLMDNHFHLAIRRGEVPLSKIMQNLLFRFTRYMNRRYGRVGHLFQGRFKSVLVDEQSYLLELVRYIHLNPVRAKVVRVPDQWVWSGHRAYLGRSKDPVLDTGWVLGVLGGKLPTARRRYAAFIQQGMQEGHRNDFLERDEHPEVLGDQEFLHRLHLEEGESVRPVPSLDRVVGLVCSAESLSEQELRRPGRERSRAQSRAVAALLAQELKAATLSEVASRFGRDVTTLSRAVARLWMHIGEDKVLAQKVDTLRKILLNERDKYANTQA